MWKLKGYLSKRAANVIIFGCDVRFRKEVMC